MINSSTKKSKKNKHKVNVPQFTEPRGRQEQMIITLTEPPQSNTPLPPLTTLRTPKHYVSPLNTSSSEIRVAGLSNVSTVSKYLNHFNFLLMNCYRNRVIK